jgi:hypothetical protein
MPEPMLRASLHFQSFTSTLMQFVKVFDFPSGQLLAERDWVRIGSGGTGYSCLLTKTKHQLPDGSVVTAISKTVYPTAQEAEAEFVAFGESRAERAFASHQQFLIEGRETTFSTDHEVVFERPKLSDKWGLIRCVPQKSNA